MIITVVIIMGTILKKTRDPACNVTAICLDNTFLGGHHTKLELQQQPVNIYIYGKMFPYDKTCKK